MKTRPISVPEPMELPDLSNLTATERLEYNRGLSVLDTKAKLDVHRQHVNEPLPDDDSDQEGILNRIIASIHSRRSSSHQEGERTVLLRFSSRRRSLSQSSKHNEPDEDFKQMIKHMSNPLNYNLEKPLGAKVANFTEKDLDDFDTRIDLEQSGETKNAQRHSSLSSKGSNLPDITENGNSETPKANEHINSPNAIEKANSISIKSSTSIKLRTIKRNSTQRLVIANLGSQDLIENQELAQSLKLSGLRRLTLQSDAKSENLSQRSSVSNASSSSETEKLKKRSTRGSFIKKELLMIEEAVPVADHSPNATNNNRHNEGSVSGTNNKQRKKGFSGCIIF